MKNQTIIIVCGFPGVGKTTLAKELAHTLDIVCLHKDTLKESLYENLAGKSLEDSMRYGKASVGILLSIADEQVSEGRDLIIESPFEFPEDYDVFKKWDERENATLYTIICQLDEEVRKQRYTSRTQGRHQAHHDHQRTSGDKKQNPYKEIPGHQIHIDTDKEKDANLNEVLNIVQKKL